MMTRSDSHEQLEELIAAVSLDGLDDADVGRLERELAAHGPECAECGRLRAQHAEAAAFLALALEPLPMSPGAEERALAAVRALDLGAPSHRARRTRGGSIRAGVQTGMRGRRWFAAIAAAAALVVAAGGGYLLRGGSQGPSSDFLAFISRPGTRSIQFPARGDEQLALYYRPGEHNAWVAGSGLSQPAGNGVYELWYRTPGAPAMTPAGTFVPSGDAVAQQVTLGTSFDTVAVSVEPHENEQPTGPVVFQASVVPVE
jgi:anti-sigma-K factor RskA